MAKPRFVFLLSLAALLGCSRDAPRAAEPQSLFMFAGAASRPPTEEVIRLFEERAGVRVEASYGGSGAVLSQMRLSKKGDLYFPGTSDFMEVAKRAGDVFAETERRVVYVVPAIIVRRGNPKGIRSLEDLLRPGLRIAIARPETVCLGVYAVEIVEGGLDPAGREALRRNVVNHTESCEKTAGAVALGAVDAVIGWSIFERWDPDRLESVKLPAEKVPRIGYASIAVARSTRNRALAERFIEFVLSAEGKAVYRRHGYFTMPDEAFAEVGAERPVGGEYSVPEGWLAR